MMTNPIEIFIDGAGTYVALHNQRTICATWNRRYAESALEHYILKIKPEDNKEVTGSWDK
jgi:hypothetical protein